MAKEFSYRFYCVGEDSAAFVDINVGEPGSPSETDILCTGQKTLCRISREFEKQTNAADNRCEIYLVHDDELTIAEIGAGLPELVKSGALGYYTLLVRQWVWIPERHARGVVLEEDVSIPSLHFSDWSG